MHPGRGLSLPSAMVYHPRSIYSYVIKFHPLDHKAKKGTEATSKKRIFSLPRWINVPQEEDVSASIEDGVSDHDEILHGFSRNLGELFRQHVSKDQFSHIIKEKRIYAPDKNLKGATWKLYPSPSKNLWSENPALVFILKNLPCRDDEL